MNRCEPHRELGKNEFEWTEFARTVLKKNKRKMLLKFSKKKETGTVQGRQCHRGSLNTLTLAKVQFGREMATPQLWERVCRGTFEARLAYHDQRSARTHQSDEPKFLPI